MSDELLSMFFDDEFVPHAYLDAFFSKDLKSNDLKNLSNIQLLQQRSSLLLSNLDFLTNELTSDLESKIDKLYNSNSIISYSYQNNDFANSADNSKLKPTSRLEYYIDSLLISIQSLNETIESIQSKIHNLKTQSSSESSSSSSSSPSSTTVDKLISLSIAKTNLFKILKFLELIKSIVDISHNEESQKIPTTTKLAPTSKTNTTTPEVIITPVEFQQSLITLGDTIREQFDIKREKESKTDIDVEFLKKVHNFLELLPIFKNLGVFYTSYNEFVKKVSKARQEYLSVKEREDDEDEADELFKQVLN